MRDHTKLTWFSWFFSHIQHQEHHSLSRQRNQRLYPWIVSLALSSLFWKAICHISLVSTSRSWEDLKWVPLFICIQFRGYHIVKIHLEYMLLQEEHRGGLLEWDGGSNLGSTSYKFGEHGKVAWHSGVSVFVCEIGHYFWTHSFVRIKWLKLCKAPASCLTCSKCLINCS